MSVSAAHVDDAAATGPNSSLEWLPGALNDVGIDLKDSTIADVGDSYNYLQVTYTKRKNIKEGTYLQKTKRKGPTTHRLSHAHVCSYLRGTLSVHTTTKVQAVCQLRHYAQTISG